MNRSEEEFFKSSTAKVIRMIELHAEVLSGKKEFKNEETVYSMSDFLRR